MPLTPAKIQALIEANFCPSKIFVLYLTFAVFSLNRQSSFVIGIMESRGKLFLAGLF